MLPPSRDRQQFPGAYAELDALDEAATRSSNIAPEGAPGTTVARPASPSGCAPVRCIRPRRHRARHRQPARRPGGPRRRRGVPAGGRAGQRLLARPTSTTPPTRSSSTASPTPCTRSTRRSSSSGFLLQVDDAVLMHECDTMMSRGRVVGRLPRVGAAARRRAQPCAARPPAGPDPLPRLLGQLARAARLRPAAARRRRSGAQVNAGAYAIEQANPRHEHEWRVWEEVSCRRARCSSRAWSPTTPTSSSTPSSSPSGLSGSRTWSAASNVMAGTDCGFAQGAFIHRVHEEVQWAKLAALAEGARIASRQLWGAGGRLRSVGYTSGIVSIRFQRRRQ